MATNVSTLRPDLWVPEEISNVRNLQYQLTVKYGKRDEQVTTIFTTRRFPILLIKEWLDENMHSAPFTPWGITKQFNSRPDSIRGEAFDNEILSLSPEEALRRIKVEAEKVNGQKMTILYNEKNYCGFTLVNKNPWWTN